VLCGSMREIRLCCVYLWEIELCCLVRSGKSDCALCGILREIRPCCVVRCGISDSAVRLAQGKPDCSVWLAVGNQIVLCLLLDIRLSCVVHCEKSDCAVFTVRNQAVLCGSL
jgi:hypothetical protein